MRKYPQLSRLQGPIQGKIQPYDAPQPMEAMSDKKDLSNPLDHDHDHDPASILIKIPVSFRSHNRDSQLSVSAPEGRGEAFIPM